MIDIHSHILPGIDDGARDLYDTLEMAQIAANSGVTHIVATPHCNIPDLYDNYFGKQYIEVFRAAKKAIQEEQIPVQLLPGMEVFGTYDVPELMVAGKIMPLNQSRYVLLEFAFDEEEEYVQDILDRVRAVNARPVIAHAERYDFVQDRPQLVYEWRRKGYLVQVNKSSFQGNFGRYAERAAYQLMDHGLISVIASDAHSPEQRTPYMASVYEQLSYEYPEKMLKVLFEENPRRICEDKPTIRFPLKPFD